MLLRRCEFLTDWIAFRERAPQTGSLDRPQSRSRLELGPYMEPLEALAEKPNSGRCDVCSRYQRVAGRERALDCAAITTARYSSRRYSGRHSAGRDDSCSAGSPANGFASLSRPEDEGHRCRKRQLFHLGRWHSQQHQTPTAPG